MGPVGGDFCTHEKNHKRTMKHCFFTDKECVRADCYDGPACIIERPTTETPGKERVNHPDHYGGDTTYEVIKVIEAWDLDRDFLLGNTVKYIARAGKKGEENGKIDINIVLTDLRKALWYLDRKIKNLENAR